MNKISIGVFLAVALFASALHGQSRDALLKAVSTAPGWTPAAEQSVYNADQIDRFDPTLAPVLKRYGIRGVAVQSWTGTHGELRASLYEMNDSPAAYGFLTIRRKSDAPEYKAFPFGAEGYRLDRRAAFWQGAYVVELEGDPQAMDDWARLVAPLISGPSARPPVSDQLPSEHRIEHTDRYTVSAGDLDSVWDFGGARLGFESSAEAATATYNIGGKSVRLLLVMYPTQQVAKKYEESLALSGGARFKKRVGPLLAFVEPGADPSSAETLLAAVRHEFQLTWNERRPGPSLPEIILGIFTFIGIALAFTLVVGIGFGGLRIFVKARYPGRIFDRPQDVEVIQLKLNQLVRRDGGHPGGGPSRHLAG